MSVDLHHIIQLFRENMDTGIADCGKGFYDFPLNLHSILFHFLPAVLQKLIHRTFLDNGYISVDVTITFACGSEAH